MERKLRINILSGKSFTDIRIRYFELTLRFHTAAGFFVVLLLASNVVVVRWNQGTRRCRQCSARDLFPFIVRRCGQVLGQRPARILCAVRRLFARLSLLTSILFLVFFFCLEQTTSSRWVLLFFFLISSLPVRWMEQFRKPLLSTQTKKKWIVLHGKSIFSCFRVIWRDGHFDKVQEFDGITNSSLNIYLFFFFSNKIEKEIIHGRGSRQKQGRSACSPSPGHQHDLDIQQHTRFYFLIKHSAEKKKHIRQLLSVVEPDGQLQQPCRGSWAGTTGGARWGTRGGCWLTQQGSTWVIF